MSTPTVGAKSLIRRVRDQREPSRQLPSSHKPWDEIADSLPELYRTYSVRRTIGEMPILEILVRQLKAQGFDWITLSVGYLSTLLEAYCGDGSQWGIRLDYVRETDPLGTAGSLGLLDDLDDQ